MNVKPYTARQTIAQRIGKWVLIAATVALLACGLLMFARLGASIWLYAAIEDWVTTRLGFDYYLAQCAATTATVAATFVLPAFAWYLFTGRKKLWGAFVPIGGWAIIYLLISTVGAQVCFDRRTGAPLCYYADTARGRIWSRTPGYDPSSGEPFRLYTREIYQREHAASRSTATPPVTRRDASPSPATREMPPAANNNATAGTRSAPSPVAPSRLASPTPSPVAEFHRSSVSRENAPPAQHPDHDDEGGSRSEIIIVQASREEGYARDAEHDSQLEQETARREAARQEIASRAEADRQAAARAEREAAQRRAGERQRARDERARERRRLMSRAIEFGIGQLERRLPPRP